MVGVAEAVACAAFPVSCAAAGIASNPYAASTTAIKDTFRIEDQEVHSEACKFEHIISPELDQRICTFLGHPKTCPHGNPIPPGDCCDGKSKG